MATHENNDDWTVEYLYCDYLEIITTSDEQLFAFLKEVVHPLVRIDRDDQYRYAETINKHLAHDRFRLSIVDYMSGYPVYLAEKIGSGVKGKVKNLIFAADGPKPEILLVDSINNDILVTKNSEHCLIYDRGIPQTGLTWIDLVTWWAENNGIEVDINTERQFYVRLMKSLDSEPEKLLFETYFSCFHNKMPEKLPALIPQVYLHYDPYTVKDLAGTKRLARQRMDFLLLFSQRDRIVIEVDGKQHYSDGEIASTTKYAEMVSADRQLRLAGYEVYRCGGKELQGRRGRDNVIDFFEKLLIKHKVP